MVYLHVAYFAADGDGQTGGAWQREWAGLVPAPEVPSTLVGDARLRWLCDWQQQVAPAEDGEVGIDVTALRWPVGDLCWHRFDAVRRDLYCPEPHLFIQIARDTRMVDVNCESGRPVASTPERLVLDITGTPLEPFYGHLFGQLVTRGGRIALEPTADEMTVPADVRPALCAATDDLALVADLRKEVVWQS
jgi:hypothetical protein